MTRIMTICSGLRQTGKTHLAVNLALELVRRGRTAAVYHVLEGSSPVDDIIELPPLGDAMRRDSDSSQGAAVCRGYQGADILSCRTPLLRWPFVGYAHVEHCIHEMLPQDGCDDLLVDTSCLSPHATLAVCLASPLLALVVTPDRRTQASAFALLRVLQLNGFAGRVDLLVNRVSHERDAVDIGNRFIALVRQHLSVDAQLLAGVPEDSDVQRARRVRQAFSSLYPDSRAAAAVIAIADQLDESGVAGDFAGFWRDVAHGLVRRMELPGGVPLDDAALRPEPTVAGQRDLHLFHYAGPVDGLGKGLAGTPQALDLLAAELDCFSDEISSSITPTLPELRTLLGDRQLLSLAARLLTLAADHAGQDAGVTMQAAGCRIGSTQGNGLRPGHYIEYRVDIALPARGQAALSELLHGLPLQPTGDGVWSEYVAPEQDCCLQVREMNGVQLRFWLPLESAGLHRHGGKALESGLRTDHKLLH